IRVESITLLSDSPCPVGFHGVLRNLLRGFSLGSRCLLRGGLPIRGRLLRGSGLLHLSIVGTLFRHRLSRLGAVVLGVLSDLLFLFHLLRSLLHNRLDDGFGGEVGGDGLAHGRLSCSSS